MRVILIRSRATDSAIFKLATSLSRNGHDVKLLLWNRHMTLDKSKHPNCEIHSFDFKAPYDKMAALPFIPIWWIYELSFLLKENYDVIHACDLDTLYPAILASRIKKSKLIYSIYDFYAHNLPDGSLHLLRRLIRKTIASIEKYGITFTDILFLADESWYEEIRGVNISKLVYLYNSPPDVMNDQNCEAITKNEEIIIFYTGVLSKVRGLDKIIEAIRGINGVILIIGGEGTEKDYIQKISLLLNQKVRYLGWIPTYEEVIRRTMESDILIRFSDPAYPLMKYESPNKLFEAMMCRKPIIVSEGGPKSEIVRKEQCGLVVPYHDINAIRNAIITLRDNSYLRDSLGANGRKAYETKYSWKIMESRLINAYSCLTHSLEDSI